MNKQSLGTTIAASRKEKGMTQLELANQLGVTDKAVSKWERDLSCPDINSFPRLAEILGVSLDELMQIKTNAREPEPPSPLRSLLPLICKALACAMGAAVTVLAALGQLDSQTGFSLLGIGLFCTGLALLWDKGNNPPA